MNNPTDCMECDNMVEASRKQHPASRMCSKFPRLNGYQFVDLQWSGELFMRCKDINGGACPLFTPIRNAEHVEADRIHRSDFEQNK